MRDPQAIKNINEQVKDKYYFQIIVSVKIDEDNVPLDPDVLSKTLKILDYNQESGDEHAKSER